MYITQKLKTFILFIPIFIIVAACSPGIEAGPTATAQPLPTEAQAEATLVPTDEAAESTEVAQQSPEEVAPTPRQGLVATDPTTVNLASGEPTLVEFFAFW